MLINLTGTHDEALLDMAADLGRRADFEIADEESLYSIDQMLNGDVGRYQPGLGVHLLTFHEHWAPLLFDEHIETMFDSEFRYSELFLQSRGVLTVPLDSGDPHLELIHQNSLTSVKMFSEEDGAEVMDFARTKEMNAQALSRWRHYIGPMDPEQLIVCRPDRATRMAILADFPEEDWMTVGIASSASAAPELDLLRVALGEPNLMGYGGMPGTTENWIETNDGVFVA